jgi:hypothetical protein
MSLGFGFSLPAYLGSGGAFAGASLNLDFTNGNNTLSPLITFSRTTNATLTNSAGLVANAPMNLLTFSEQFDNAAWVPSAVSITANSIIAPNGTQTADTLTTTSVFNSFRQTADITVTASTTYTLSFYAYRGTATDAKYSIFNSTAGSDIVASTSYFSQTVAGAWSRVTLTFTTPVGCTSIRVFLLRDTGVLGSISIWGAQLELGSTATTYNPTTVKNLLGFTENFDNAAWTKSNAFVQTNLLLQSEAFDSASWFKQGATVTANTTVAPNGSMTADTIAAAGGGFSQYVNQEVAAAAGQQLTYSFYILKTTGTTNGLYGGFSVEFRTASTALAEYGATIDSDSGSLIAASGWGTAGFASSSVVDAGNYWRIIGVTPAAPATTTVVRVYNAVAGYFLNGTRSGTGTSSKVLWGAQLVQGTSAGDYKATYAAAAAVGYTDIYGQPFAQKLVATNTASTTRAVYQSFTPVLGTPYSVSFFVKAAEYSKFSVNEIGNGRFGATFDLAAETTTSLGGLNFVSSSISAVGNGWYRCAIIATGSSVGWAVAAVGYPTGATLTTAGTSYAGDGTSGIYIFGAQLSDSASVDPYVYQPVAAPTSTACYGPRFDYDPVTLAPKGLLIEEQRTNLVTYSEMFSDAAWSKQSSSVTANTAVAPNGAQTASTLTASSGTAFHYANRNAAVVISGANTFSFYVKKSNSTWIFFTLRDTSVNYFNLDTGAFGTTPDTCISQNVGNGWYRISVTRTDTTANCGIGIAGSNNNALFTATGTEAVFIWGAQLEAGAFATSYIPTVASQVTRAADSASMIGNNFARWYNVNEGTLLADYNNQITLTSVNYGVATIKDSGADNAIGMLSGLSSGFTNFVSRTSGVIQASLATSSNSPVNNKLAGAYAVNNFGAAVNGADLGTDTSGTLPVVDRMLIGANRLTNPAGQITLKRIAYYNRRLSNTELQGLTS